MTNCKLYCLSGHIKTLIRVLRLRLLIFCTAVFFLAVIIAALVFMDPYYADVEPLPVSDASALANQSVLIVGAGFTGLFTAYTFSYLGFDNFQVLEAADDVGGRVREIDFLEEVPLDGGAEWIHAHPSILQDLLLFPEQKVDVETIAYQPQTYRVWKNGKNRKRNWIRFFYREWKFKNTTWHSYLKTYILPYVSEKIQYNAAVSKIDYSRDLISVQTKDGREFQADKVVVTSSIATMQAGDIQFVPSLPSKKQKAIDNVEMVDGMKVYFEFDKDFYPDMQILSPLWSFLNDESEDFFFDPLFRKGVENRNLLCYFHASPGATAWVKKEEEELVSDLLQMLDDIYDGKASMHYRRHLVMNWSNVPFVKGAYSYDMADYSWTHRELNLSVQDKIFFAGEHTEGDDQATVHGAAKAGRRVAGNVIISAGGSTRSGRNLLRK